MHARPWLVRDKTDAILKRNSLSKYLNSLASEEFNGCQTVVARSLDGLRTVVGRLSGGRRTVVGRPSDGRPGVQWGAEDVGACE